MAKLVGLIEHYVVPYVSDYIPEILLGVIAVLVAAVAALVTFIIRYSLYSQRTTVAFVRDDSREESLVDILQFDEAHNAGLLADCALLSANIYRNRDYVSEDNLERLTKTQRLSLSNWTEVDPEFYEAVEPPYRGIRFPVKYEVWRNEKNEKNKVIAIVFRGTVPGLNSWIANMHWIFRLVPFVRDQYDRTKLIIPAITKQLSKEIADGVTLIATGHSLGGGLAQHSVYLSPDIKIAYAFNASPVTGWYDVRKKTRIANAAGSRIYRIHENGEILQFLRLFMKIAYLFNPRPNQDPYFAEYRINLRIGGGLIGQHAMMPIAGKLTKIRREARTTPAST